jgi:hypothetical protein
MIDGALQPAPSTDGIDFEDGFQSMQYQLSQNEWIRSSLERLAQRANEPKYIMMPDGRPLSDLGKDAPWSGVVWMLDTTLSEAHRECRKHNFRVQDGSRGTNDMREKFVRGAPAGSNAGDTGGAAAGSIIIDNHAVHNHTASSAASGSCCNFQLCGGGTAASLANHTHAITVVNNAAAQSHSGTFEVATLPPYYEVIFARRT